MKLYESYQLILRYPYQGWPEEAGGEAGGKISGLGEARNV